MIKNRKWYDYLWIFSSVYLVLGFFNIIFAWIGLLCFFIPIFMSIFGGGKVYCHKYCGRGQMFDILGNKFRLTRNKNMPNWLRSKWFRYGFLIFFFTMFFNMLFTTYLVFAGSNSLKQVVTLIWTIKVPWKWAYHGTVISPWVSQFAFGFYSIMLTSTILGMLLMVLFRPRSWCVVCPMGTMTQLICKAKNIGQTTEKA